MTEHIINQLPVFASAYSVRYRFEEPRIYKTGGMWRFSWAEEDHGSFKSEEEAKDAALAFKNQTIAQLFTGNLSQD